MKLVAIFLIAFASEADYKSTFKFSNGSEYFQFSLSSNRALIKDKFGSREVSISKCNEQKVKALWKDISKAVEKIGFVKKGEKTSASIVYEGVEFSVSGLDPMLRYFNNLPIQKEQLLLEIKQACK